MKESWQSPGGAGQMSGGDGDYARRSHFLNAVILSCQAVMEYAQRYAALAEKRAAECSDPVRRNELEVIALNCSRVPGKGAGSFMRHVSLSGLFSSYSAGIQRSFHLTGTL